MKSRILLLLAAFALTSCAEIRLLPNSSSQAPATSQGTSSDPTAPSSSQATTVPLPSSQAQESSVAPLPSSQEPVVQSSEEPLVSSEVSEESSQEPEESSLIPVESSQQEEESSATPEESSYVPVESSQEEEESSATPEESSYVPVESSQEEEESSFIPEESSQIPEESSQIPEESSFVPEESSTSPIEPTWELITDINELNPGDTIAFANPEYGYVAGVLSSTKNARFLAAIETTFSQDSSIMKTMPDDSLSFVLGKDGDYWTFQFGEMLLGATAAKKLAFGEGETRWKLSSNAGVITIANANSDYGTLQFNSSTPRFTTYTSSQKAVSIYRGGTAEPVFPTAITIEGDNEVQVGRFLQLSAAFEPANTNQKNVTWTSSDPTVASVDEDGLVTGLSVGTATITAEALNAESETISDSLLINVTEFQKDAYTIMIYMCGSNLESYDSSYGYYGSQASDNLWEIAQVANIPSNVNIIVETGGANDWDPDYAEDLGASIPSELTRWTFQNQKLVKEPAKLQPEDASMGLSSTFSDFLEWGIRNYPADKTGVILWNHGGAMSGCCQDERFNYDTLSPVETYQAIGNAFTATGCEKLEWIGYDCCLMAVQDIAELNSDYFDYQISSQESEPGGGWDYDAWVAALAADPEITTYNLGRTIIDSYVQKCADYYNQLADYAEQYPDEYGDYAIYRDYNDATLSLLDLTKIGAYRDAFEEMAGEIASIVTSSSKWDQLASIANKCQRYGHDDTGEYDAFNDGYIFDIFDAMDFFYLLKEDSTFASVDTSAAIDTLQKVVTYSHVGSAHSGSYGLCFFIAISGYAFASEYSTQATRFSTWQALNAQYGSFY